MLSRAAVQARYPHYFAVRAAARALGLPTHYKRDLTLHYRRTLGAMPVETPFVWCVRDCGTHIVRATDRHDAFRVFTGEHYAYGNPPSRLLDGIANAFGADKCRWFTWDGVKLRAVSLEKARLFIDVAHSRVRTSDLTAPQL